MNGYGVGTRGVTAAVLLSVVLQIPALAGGEPSILSQEDVASSPEGGGPPTDTAEGSPDTAEADGARTDQRSPIVQHLLESPRLTGDWGGLRTDIEDIGILLSFYFNHQYGVNTRGGQNTSNAQKHSLSGDYFVQTDFEKMGLVPGGEALLQAKSNLGRNINPDVGAISDPIDDADFDSPIYVDQLWYQQSLLDRLFQLRLGYLDLQTIIDRNAYANSEDVQFMNTFLDNNNGIIPLTIGFGAAMWADPTDWLEFIVGTSDADNRIRLAGFDTAFDDFKSLMVYGEGAVKVSLESSRGSLPGKYRVGVFYDPRTVADYTSPPDPADPSGPSGTNTGYAGVYLSFDQLIYREGPKDQQGLGVFLRYGYKDEDRHQIAHVWSTGVQYVGLLPGRDTDGAGLGIYHVIASSTYRDNYVDDFKGELGVELYYRVQITPWFALTPDFQYIVNPGGLSAARDSVVLALRSRITF